MASVRDILINLIGRETISPAARKAGGALGDLGDDMGDAERAAKSLDRQIDQVQRSLKVLATQSATAGGDAAKEITKQIREQERSLRQLTRRRKLLDFDPAPIVDGIGTQLAGAISKGVRAAPMGPAGAAVGAAIAVPAAAMVGSAIGGAVLGGVGVGGVIGGLVMASRDSRVQAAGADLAAQVGRDLERSGGQFVGPAIGGIREIRSAWSDVAGDVDGIFAATSRYVQPLARGVGGLARELGPALSTAARAAEPVIRQLAEGLPRIGRAVGDLLRDASGEAKSGAAAVQALIFAVEGGIRGVGTLVRWMSSLWEVMVKVGAVSYQALDNVTWDRLPWIGEKAKEGRDKFAEMNRTLEETGETGDSSLSSLYDSFMRAAEGAEEATVDVEMLDDAIQRLAEENLTARAAVRNLEAAYDDATAAVKANGRTLDEGTAKGRANAEALDRIVREAKAARDAIIAQKGSQGEANEVMAEARRRFIDTAVAMGKSRDEAKKLADQLFGIPSVKPKVEVEAAGGRKAVQDFLALYAKVKNKSVTISGTVRWTSKGLKVPGGTILEGFAEGGPIRGPGPKGVDSRLIAAAPGEHMWTADEVDAAGGHAAVERLRQSVLSGRSTSPVSAAAPPGGGTRAGGGGVTTIRIVSDGSPVGRWLMEILRSSIRIEGGGNVQMALGS